MSFETPSRPKTQEEIEKEEMAREAREKEAGFKSVDKREYLDKALEETERGLALTAFKALSQKQREDLIFQLYKEKRIPEVKKKVEEAEMPPAEPARPATETPPATEAPPAPPAEPEIPITEAVPTPKVEGWRAILQPYDDRVKKLGKQMKVAQSGGKIFEYANLRAEAIQLLKDFQHEAKMRERVEKNPATKKLIRQYQSDIEQELSKLKAELTKMEHFKNPVRSVRNLFRR